MSEHDRLTALVLERLASPGNVHRTQLAELVVDHALRLRVRDVVDPAQLHAAVLQGLSADNLRRVVERHTAPGFTRYAGAIADHGARVGSLVSPIAHQKLHAIARKFRLPRARWADNAFDPALVRQLLRPVWTQVLLNFAKKLPVPGMSSAAANSGRGAASSGSHTLTSMLTRTVQERAEKLIDRGRTAMGGLGAEVERRMSAAARDFSDTAAQAFRASLLERLNSDEGRELVGQVLAGLTDHVLRTRFSDLQADVDTLPVAEILDLVPDLVSFAARSGYVQEIVERELDDWMASQGPRPLGELLEEYGLLAQLRPMLLQRIEAVTAGLVARPEFAAWLGALLRFDDKAE